MVVPSLNQIGANQEELARLQKLQVEQDAKINELSSLLGPLSPSGQIPGLNDPDAYFEQPTWTTLTSSSTAMPSSTIPPFANAEDFNFGLGVDGETHADKDTPSSTGTEEIQREDLDVPRETRGSKRQRTT